MNTKEVLDILKARGLQVVLVNGRPELLRASSNPAVTDALLRVLKIHRERIIAVLSKP